MHVVCFGSLNYDLAVRVPRLPGPDETLAAHGIDEFLGGKGANQATAVARLGAEVEMVGQVGHDGHGDAILAGLDRNSVGARHVRRVDGPTGIAIPLVADDGEVSIIIVHGANGEVSAALADAAAETIQTASVLLLQGEVPVVASIRAAEIAAAAGVTVVVNPAPMPAEPERLVACADHLIVNRPEAAALGVESGDGVIVTLGAAGVQVGDVTVDPYPATVVDPTGAGDAFCGAFAVATAEGASPVEAARFAAAAGSWAVRIPGAEPSMPTRANIAEVQAET